MTKRPTKEQLELLRGVEDNFIGNYGNEAWLSLNPVEHEALVTLLDAYEQLQEDNRRLIVRLAIGAGIGDRKDTIKDLVGYLALLVETQDPEP